MAPKRYSFPAGEIVGFRSLQINGLERQKNIPFLEGEEKGDLERDGGKPRSEWKVGVVEWQPLLRKSMDSRMSTGTCLDLLRWRKLRAQSAHHSYCFGQDVRWAGADFAAIRA